MTGLSIDRPKKKNKQGRKQADSPPLNIKGKLALKKEERQKKQKLGGLIIFAICVAILLGLPLSLLFDAKIGAGVSVSLILVVFSFMYPRMALWAFIIYVPFNGTIVYWLGGSQILQLTKDIFYIPALIALILECRTKQLPIIVSKQLGITLLLLFVFCAVCLLAVNLQKQLLPTCDSVAGMSVFSGDRLVGIPCRTGEPFLQGLLGFKVLLGYVPLIFCTYYLIKDKPTLLFFGRLLVTLVIICCVLGLMQYWMLKTGRCQGTRGLVADALFKAHLDARCLVGGGLAYSPEVNMIRLPGTFVSPWHWAWFLVSSAVICYASAFSEISQKWRLAALVGLTLVFINAVVSGQRLAFFAVPMIIGLLTILTGQIANLKRFLPIIFAGTLLLAIGFSFLNPDFVQQRYDSAVSRWQQAPPSAFIQEQMDFAIRNQGGILGRGLGVATSAARVFGDISFVETYHTKVLFELGYIGFTLYMIFMTHLVYLAFRTYRSLKDPTLRGFAGSYWVFLLFVTYLPYWYALDTDPVGVYYWIFAGVIFKLPVIEKQEKEAKILAGETETKSSKKGLKFKRKGVSLA
ncbi:hormogonium polysaccharide biosynthesis protein HpsL [Microcystis aeruginosa]|uniref:hormogonium polysaccharide biosynthesis protein HpsL n=1 Tax=Microcystis aeruginosa TaxID=1126 RepID=UPI00232A91AB|nr:hormogonium polysaccharide biosynthesis protein HpsL [Microcystis aeruginosa]MDB9415953.1 hormogonium polysaccharide biosynthesis protein HpsL [Microcystis aeruginosa CS-556/03]